MVLSKVQIFRPLFSSYLEPEGRQKSTHIDRLNIDREVVGLCRSSLASCCGASISMEGWNGYRRETVSSSRSGTIVSGLSTAYTSRSSGSRFSTFSAEAAAMHFASLGIHEELDLGIHVELDLGIHEELDGDNMDDREEAEEEEEEEETREDSIRRLVKELFSAPSGNCSIKRDDDMSVVERWVIASPKDGSSSAKELANEARSWIRRIENEMTILLAAYEDKLGEAIRSTMEKIRMMSMEDGNDSPIPLNPQGSLDIHKESQHFYYHGLSDQIEGHVERYLQVSWESLLSCLFNPTPLCLGKISSPLSKFESKFQKIYTTQKEWKVPDPLLRSKLRQAIIDKIIPRYKKYVDDSTVFLESTEDNEVTDPKIKDNKVTDPKINPQELEAMLQELFEG
nr:unnamed protein product [Digitaria exilis]